MLKKSELDLKSRLAKKKINFNCKTKSKQPENNFIAIKENEFI